MRSENLLVQDQSGPQPERFYKVNYDGELLEPNADFWSCVYDSSTGLLWEVKRDDGGWQDRENTYSWYFSIGEGSIGEGPIGERSMGAGPMEEEPMKEKPMIEGVQDQGDCYGTRCDTDGYVEEMRLEGLCGTEDWRLPEAHELRLLDHPVNYYPDIDTRYFSQTMSGRYWTRTEVPERPSLAWSVDFHNGFPYIAEKRLTFHVRLVAEANWLNDIFNEDP
ncbi:DUF1566 domain-containing protein [Hahella ganghwensis]|uniref:Lcl C-terminal domain-containing protein n=1 Tax=Hahella ganghwensis TaxID=286420 RepID=UPI0012F875AB|nr:DUF1566 domain-containing protein [Hahella ganghwensis]